MAREGHPCPGCFNPDLWIQEGYQRLNWRAVYNDIVNLKNPYVTFVGGEPLDQYDELVLLFEELSKTQHHICLITHYTMDEILLQFSKVLDFANTIIDGKYEADKRIFDENKKPGIYQIIGSKNQNIWINKHHVWIEVDKDAEDLSAAYDFISQ